MAANGSTLDVSEWQDSLVLRWREATEPFPVQTLRSPPPSGFLQEAPPWLATGPLHVPFDFCGHMRRLLEDVALRCPKLSHLQVPKMLVGMTVARNGRKHGLLARVTPLRFGKGALTHQRRGVIYQVQRFFLDDHEYLYHLTFCLPRFLNQDFDGKLITIFHELFHIHPNFDGDLRRHGGRYDLHTHSQKEYDRHMADLARAYLDEKPPADLVAFLRLTFAQLCQRHGGVSGIVVPRPRVFPVSWKNSSAARKP